MDKVRLATVEGVAANVTIKCERTGALLLTYPLTASKYFVSVAGYLKFFHSVI